MGINSSMYSDLPRYTPTEDLVLSGQQMEAVHCCHGPEVVYAVLGNNGPKPSQSSFPYQGKCFADANRRGSALVPSLCLPHPGMPSGVTTKKGGFQGNLA